MKTPMQEMYDQLKASRNDDYGLAFAIDLLLENEEVMLEKEKEVIKNSYIEGCGDNILCESTDKKRAEEYYNETFNTKER